MSTPQALRCPPLMEPAHTVGIVMPIRVHDKLRKWAFERNVTQAHILRTALDEYFEKHAGDAQNGTA